MAADFVARLGSRASVPAEVRSSWSVPEYVGLLAGGDRVAAELAERVYGGRLGRLAPERLMALLRALARSPSAELNQARVAATAGIPATTLGPYIAAAVRLGLILLVPGSRAAVTRRSIARPRVVFPDPAVACHLAGENPAQLVELGARGLLASYLEGIVFAELVRQQVSSAVEFGVSHLRERNGLAVDLVVELPDETVYGIEVRTAASLRPHQFRNLEALAARAGWRMRGGIVFNTAPVGHEYRADMWSLPVSALWDWDQGGGQPHR